MQQVDVAAVSKWVQPTAQLVVDALSVCLSVCLPVVQDETVYETPFNDKNPRRTMKVGV